MNNLSPVRLLKTAHKLWSDDVTYLIFNVTNKCNAFCDHCFNWKKVQAAGVSQNVDQLSKRNELSLAEIEQVSKSLPNLLLLNLCGGEPFMRRDLPEIIQIFKKNSNVNYVTIPTNGFLEDFIPQQLEKICTENPDIFFRIGLSVDGFAERHDRIRRHKGGFEKAMRTARRLHELKKKVSNFSVGVSTVFSADTQDTVDSLLDYLHKLEIFDILTVLHIRGKPRDFDLMNVDLRKYEQANKKIEEFGKFKRHPASYLLNAMHAETVKKVIQAQKSTERVFKCYAGQKLLILDDVGEVYACEILEDKPLGNIRDHGGDINQLIKTQQAKEVIQFIKDKKCACSWECAIHAGWLFNAFTTPKLAAKGFLPYFGDLIK